MATSNIDKEIRARIDTFISELSQLVKDAALEAVQDALGGNSTSKTPARRSNATTSHSTAGTTGAVSSARQAAKRRGRRHRRTAADLHQMAGRIFDHVKSNPGQRMEEISSALGELTYDLRRPLQQLKIEKAFKTTGQKRATQYYLRAGAKKRAKSA